MNPQQSETVQAPTVGDVQYQLRHDWTGVGPHIIERIEVMAICESRDEAREWMLANVKNDLDGKL